MKKKINIHNIKSSGNISKDILFAPDLISTDTRSIRAGGLFIPLAGENFDGHNFIDKAFENGAGFCLYDPKRYNPKEESEKLLPVTNTLTAYQEIAHSYRTGLSNTKVISITGSSGKTTVKEILKIVLSNYGSTYATEKNFNNEVGVPKTLLNIKDTDKFAVVEMGARHLHDISPLVKTAAPDAVILTCVGSSHIGEFGSLENIYKTKLEIIKDSPAGCLKIGPQDDSKIVEVLKQYPNHLTVGTSTESNVQILDAKSKPGNTTISYKIAGKIIEVNVPFFHATLPINVGYALAVCYGLGLNLDQFASSLKNFNGLEGRYQIIEKAGKSFVDDAYNANRDSMIMGLTSFKQSFESKNPVLVLGDMLELGEESKTMHEEVGEFVAKHLPKAKLVAVGSEAKHITASAISHGFDNTQISQYSNYEELISKLDKILNLGDSFYIKASNGTGLHFLAKSIKEL